MPAMGVCFIFKGFLQLTDASAVFQAVSCSRLLWSNSIRYDLDYNINVRQRFHGTSDVETPRSDPTLCIDYAQHDSQLVGEALGP